jgi:hypothetical protein
MWRRNSPVIFCRKRESDANSGPTADGAGEVECATYLQNLIPGNAHPHIEFSHRFSILTTEKQRKDMPHIFGANV